MRWFNLFSLLAFAFLVFTSMAMAQGVAEQAEEGNTMWALIK